MKCRADLLVIAALLSVIGSAVVVRAQQEQTLDATRQRFPDAGAGIRAIRRGRDGLYYVLTAAKADPKVPTSKRSKRSSPETPPASLVLVFDAEGRKVRQIPESPRAGEIVSASGLDLDGSGRVYIADQSGNGVIIYAADGALFAHVAVPEPTEIVALPGDRFAACSANADHLMAVYDLHGTLIREFGEFEELSDDAELNQRLNQGHLASDKAGNLYFAFRYMPEPTVRKYDPATGNLIDEFSLRTLDLEPMAQSAHQQIARMASGKAVLPHEIISALGVDPDTQELWLALGNLLMRFDNPDSNNGGARAYTPSGARMVPNFILTEKDDLLLGNNELGIYEFPRDFKKFHGYE